MSKFIIDLPNPFDIEGPWVQVKESNNYLEMITFIKENLGGDDYGKIFIISKMEEE